MELSDLVYFPGDHKGTGSDRNIRSNKDVCHFAFVNLKHDSPMSHHTGIMISLLFLHMIVTIVIMRDETATQNANPAAPIFNGVPVNLVKSGSKTSRKAKKIAIGDR